MYRTLLLTITLTLAMNAGARPVQGTRPMPNFAEFDLNGDGYISEEEFIDSRNKKIAERAGEGRLMRGLDKLEEFADIDTDGDGTISREEFSAYQLRHQERKPAGYNRPNR